MKTAKIPDWSRNAAGACSSPSDCPAGWKQLFTIGVSDYRNPRGVTLPKVLLMPLDTQDAAIRPELDDQSTDQ